MWHDNMCKTKQNENIKKGYGKDKKRHSMRIWLRGKADELTNYELKIMNKFCGNEQILWYV